MQKKLYVFILSVAMSVPMSAQRLTGSVDAYGSWNFDKGHKENAAMTLHFDSTLYYVHMGVRGSHNYTPTTEYTRILSESIEKQNMSVKTDANQLDTRKWNMSANLDFGYHLSRNDLLTVRAEYAYDDTRKNELLISNRYLLATNPDLTIRMDTLLGDQHDRTLAQRHTIKARMDYKHQFSVSNWLYLSLDTYQAFGGDGKQRELSGNMFANSRNYTDANVLSERNYQLSLHYDDEKLCGVERLKLKAGIDLLFDNDGDQYRADYNEPGLRDTTILRFHRSYLSQFTEPFVNLQYSIKGWNFAIKERPQLYSNLQWEMLNVQSPQLLNSRTQFANITEANIGYRLKERHRFELSYNYNVVRPDYKQFSTMMRLSNSEGEFIQGNDSLRPEKRHKANFRYSYKKDEHMLTSLDVFYLHRKDKIEKVVVVNETSNKEIKTLKTFANANVQQGVGGTLRLKLKYEAVEAEAWSSVTWEHFTYYSGAKPKDEVNYQLGLWLNAHLNKWIDLTSSMVYVSPTQSAFTEKNEYIGADLRMTYKSPVGLKIFIEANDIINKPRTETTWNESMTYMKVKEVVENRNCLGIGVRYDW